MLEKKTITTYEEAVAYLLEIPRFTSKNTLEDTKAYLHLLGDPDRKMRIIHVAGTNGKGSVCAYLRAVLEEAGYTTTMFTSPHLVDVRERFLIKGQLVAKEAFLKAFLQIYHSLDWETLEQGSGYHPTFFEYLFFMAMLLFAEADADYCILETGLGGRLDATNAVSRKELAVLTHISRDHVEYLGDTITQIAGEKAGIIQAKRPVVFADMEQESSAVFVEKAKELGCPCYPVSKKDYTFFKLQNKTIDFFLQTKYYGYISLSLHTIARYQMENAALAIRTLEALQDVEADLRITEEQLKQGIGKCFWQGRMEEVAPEVYVDGAHNEDGIRAFLDTVGTDGWQGNRILLFSVVQDKDYEQMIKELVDANLFTQIAVTRLHNSRGASLSSIEDVFQKYPGYAFREYSDVESALQQLLEQRGEQERIYIAGSLYLVGEIKRYLGC